MKKLYILFAIACVFKILTMLIVIPIKQQKEEINKFYTSELNRKYQEHNHLYNVLRGAISNNKKIPSTISTQFKKSEGKQGELFYRTWFQDMHKSFRELFPEIKTLDPASIKNFPKQMQNTVLEGRAINAIWELYEAKGWYERYYSENKFMGVINSIALQEETMSIDIKSYCYSTTEQFDVCLKSSEDLVITSNPFYYKGPLKGWLCRWSHPVTKEIYEIRFD